MRPCGDDVRSVLRFEHRQAGVVDKSKEDLAHIKRLPNIRIDQRKKVLGRIARSKWLDQVQLGRSTYLERSYPFSGLLDSIESGV